MKAATSGLQYGSLDQRGRKSLTKDDLRSSGASKSRKSSSSPSKSEDAREKNLSRSNSQERKRFGRLENASSGDSLDSGGAKDANKQRKKSDAKGLSDMKTKERAGPEQGVLLPTDTGTFPVMMKLTEALPSEKEDVFRRKMQACSVIYDFRSDSCQREKEAKRCTLLELIEYISSAKNCFNEQLMSDALDMVSKNIFRAMELKERSLMLDLEMEEEEIYMDAAWPHLSLVYEFLLRFVICKEIDPKRMAKWLEQDFILKLLFLFESDDPRERDSLKMIMFRIYSRFTSMRTRLRWALCDACLRAAYESETANGIAELLEIHSKVISGFGTPLKDEHREVLTKVLVPLHKVGMLTLFHRQLCNCVLQFAEKEREICYDVVCSLLSMWPVTQAAKQCLFIGEVEEILNIMRPVDFVRVQDAFVSRLCLCITCQHSQVAEAAMSLWNNSTFVKLIYDSREVLFPTIISALYKNSTQHWYGPVHGRTFEVLKLMMEADEQLFDESSAKHRKKGEEEEYREVVRAKRWQVLNTLFEKKEKERALAAPKKKAIAAKSEAKAKAKRAAVEEAAKSTLTRREAMPLKEANYGVAISNESPKDALELQALVVDTQGKIISLITMDNFMAMKAAIVHVNNGYIGRRQPTPIATAEGEESSTPSYRSIIWVTLSRLPPHVKTLVFVAIACEGNLRDVGGQVHILEEGVCSTNDITSFKLEASSAIGVLAVIERTSPEAWRMAKIVTTVKSTGRNYWDILEPNLGTVIREAIPEAVKPQKVSFSLEKCALTYIPSPLAPKGAFIGVGWDFSPNAPDQLVVDVAAVLFNVNGQDLGAVCSDHPEDRGIRHSGSGIVSAGVAVNIDAIPSEVAQIFIIANVAALGMNYEQIQNPCCRMIDHAGAEVVRYLHQETGRKPGLILSRLCREIDDRKWTFQAIGTFCSGHTWKESLKDVRPLFLAGARELQQRPENSAPAVPTRSGRLMVSL